MTPGVRSGMSTQESKSLALVWRSDVHMADYGPSSRLDDWSETVLKKLAQVGQIAREVDAHAVLDGGDFFHVKSPGRNSHKMLQRVAEVHKAYPCPTYANVGNHDVKYGDWTFLSEAPLGVLFSTGVFKRCYDEYEATFGDEYNGGSGAAVKVRVVGIPYHGTKYDLARFARIRKEKKHGISKTGEFLVVMCHLLASPEGGSMFEAEDIIRYDDLQKLCPDADVFCFGHWHKNQGVRQLSSGQWVVNTGSLTRGALTQDEMDRVPVVTVMRFYAHGKISIEERPIKVEDPEKVFDVAGRVRAEARETTMEAFVSSFKDALKQTEGKPLIETIMDAPGIITPVKERAIHYLEMQKK